MVSRNGSPFWRSLLHASISFHHTISRRASCIPISQNTLTRRDPYSSPSQVTSEPLTMHNFLKSLFKPPSTRSKRSTHPLPVPPEYLSPELSPASSQQHLPTDDLAALADLLRSELEMGGRHRRLLHHGEREQTMERVLEALGKIRRARDEETITPFQADEGEGSPVERAARAMRRERKGKGAARGGGSSAAGDSQMERVIEACTAALGEHPPATSVKISDVVRRSRGGATQVEGRSIVQGFARADHQPARGAEGGVN